MIKVKIKELNKLFSTVDYIIPFDTGAKMVHAVYEKQQLKSVSVGDVLVDNKILSGIKPIGDENIKVVFLVRADNTVYPISIHCNEEIDPYLYLVSLGLDPKEIVKTEGMNYMHELDLLSSGFTLIKTRARYTKPHVFKLEIEKQTYIRGEVTELNYGVSPVLNLTIKVNNVSYRITNRGHYPILNIGDNVTITKIYRQYHLTPSNNQITHCPDCGTQLLNIKHSLVCPSLNCKRSTETVFKNTFLNHTAFNSGELRKINNMILKHKGKSLSGILINNKYQAKDGVKVNFKYALSGRRFSTMIANMMLSYTKDEHIMLFLRNTNKKILDYSLNDLQNILPDDEAHFLYTWFGVNKKEIVAISNLLKTRDAVYAHKFTSSLKIDDDSLISISSAKTRFSSGVIRKAIESAGYSMRIAGKVKNKSIHYLTTEEANNIVIEYYNSI